MGDTLASRLFLVEFRPPPAHPVPADEEARRPRQYRCCPDVVFFNSPARHTTRCFGGRPGCGCGRAEHRSHPRGLAGPVDHHVGGAVRGHRHLRSQRRVPVDPRGLQRLAVYNITVGAFLLMAGRFADSIGRRKVFLPGVALFGVASLLCAIAPSAGWLIFFRLLQGAGGSVVNAASFAVMLPAFPPARRSTAIGIAGAAGGMGSVIGPGLGSFLIDVFSWRAIFMNATGRIDFLGVIIGTASVALAMFAIVQSESWGVGDSRVIALFIIGLALTPVLLRRSRTHPEPLINLDLFKFQSFSSATLGTALYSLGFTAGFLTNSLVLQDAWDQPLRTVGLALIIPPAISMVASILTGRVADRYGHRWILGLGSVLCGATYLLYALLLGDEPQVWSVFVPIGCLLGIGVGMTIATWSSAGLSDIPQGNFGVAGATYNTLRQAAYGLGIAASATPGCGQPPASPSPASPR